MEEQRSTKEGFAGDGLRRERLHDQSVGTGRTESSRAIIGKLGRLLFFVLLTELVITSCGVRYVPIESVRTEYKTLHTSDTIRLTDSVKLTQRADTIFVEKTRYRDRISKQVDTLLRVDTVQVVKEVIVEKPVKRGITDWGFIGIVILFVLALLAIGKIKDTYRLWR